MKAIVHIGWPKTGSSAIQDFLRHNTDALAGRGVRYKRNEERGSQLEYAAAIAGFERFASVPKLTRQRFRLNSAEEIDREHGKHLRALADYPKIYSEPQAVFSSEHIIVWVRKPEAIKAFDDHFSAIFDEVSYLAYMRDPLDVVPSEISERAKRGEPVRTQKYVQQFVKQTDWGVMVRNWVNVVGKERFDLRRLDRSKLHGGDLITDFCQAVGVSHEGLKAPKFANESLTLPGILAMHDIAPMVQAVDVKNGRPDPDFKALVKRVGELTADGQKLRLTEKQRTLVSEATAGWQEELRATFFPENAHLFAPKEIKERMRPKVAAKQAKAVVAQIEKELDAKAFGNLARIIPQPPGQD